MAETQLVLQTLVKGTEQARKALGDIKGSLDGLGKTAQEANQKTQIFSDKTKDGFQSLGVTAGVVTAGMVVGIKGTISEAEKLQNALVGLESIVVGTGGNFKNTKKFLDEFTADGLVPMSDASTSLKNLLSRGFGLEEASTIMGRFKDSASFGRQAALRLGEAIKGATEGLKNENSVLVDNAGVTKNVSMMWQEYADAHNLSVKDLTVAQKRQAEYNGILEETKFQVGDAVKLSNGYSGAIARQEAETVKLKASIGSALMPAMAELSKSITGILQPITEWVSKHPELTANIILATTVIAGLTAGLVALGFIIPPLVAGISAIGVVVGAISLPMIAIIATITAVGIAIYEVWKNWDTIKPKLIGIWDDLKAFLNDTWIGIKNIFSTGLNFISSIWNTIWNSIKTVFQGIWAGIGVILGLSIQLLTGDIDGFLKNISAIWNIAWNAIKTVLSTIWEGMKLVLSLAFEGISFLISSGLSGISAIWSTTWGLIKTTLSTIWEGIKFIITGAIDFLTLFFTKDGRQKIYNGFIGMFEGIGDFVSSLFDGIVNGIKSAINSMISLINSAIKAANKLPGVSFKTIAPVAISGARAKGGPVNGGSTYLVGEKGPELFTPRTGGQIIPNNRLGGSGGANIVFNFSGTFGQGVADEIGNMIVSKLKRASYI